jgi:dihydrofolate reductase
MTVVVCDITMSLDGFVTGPDPGPSNGLGTGGDALHEWVFSGDDVDRSVLTSSAERSGAVIMGRRLFDIIDGPDGWSDEVGYGADAAAKPAFFCVTHSPPPARRLVDHDFTFVPSVPDAVGAARAAASPLGKDVVVMGGGEVISQVLSLGLADELVLHLAPLVLGAGTPLFSGGSPPLALTQRSVVVSRTATHLTYTT